MRKNTIQKAIVIAVLGSPSFIVEPNSTMDFPPMWVSTIFITIWPGLIVFMERVNPTNERDIQYLREHGLWKLRIGNSLAFLQMIAIISLLNAAGFVLRSHQLLHPHFIASVAVSVGTFLGIGIALKKIRNQPSTNNNNTPNTKTTHR